MGNFSIHYWTYSCGKPIGVINGHGWQKDFVCVPHNVYTAGEWIILFRYVHLKRNARCLSSYLRFIIFAYDIYFTKYFLNHEGSKSGCDCTSFGSFLSYGLPKSDNPIQIIKIKIRGFDATVEHNVIIKLPFKSHLQPKVVQIGHLQCFHVWCWNQQFRCNGPYMLCQWAQCTVLWL